MKTLITLENLEVQGTKIGKITLEQEYTVKDVIELAHGAKDFMCELTNIFTEVDMTKCPCDTFEEIGRAHV